MTQKTFESETLKLVKSWPRSLRFDIEEKVVTAQSRRCDIKLECTPRLAFSSVEIVNNGKKVPLGKLKANIFISFESQVLESETIGVITFCHTIKTDDGVVDDPESLEIKLVATSSAFEYLYRIIFLDDLSARACTIDILGLGDSDGVWDVSKSNPRLLIKDFYISAETGTTAEHQDGFSLKSLDERLGRIEEKLTHGIKISLF